MNDGEVGWFGHQPGSRVLRMDEVHLSSSPVHPSGSRIHLNEMIDWNHEFELDDRSME